MSKFYEITKADKANTWRSKFAEGEGDDIQTWFLNVVGVEETVMQNTKIANSVQLGQTYGSMEEFASRKSGKPYFKFKKKEVPEGLVAPPTSAPVKTGMSVEVEKILLDNNRMLKELTGQVKENIEPPKVDTVLEDMTDEDVDLSDIPF